MTLRTAFLLCITLTVAYTSSAQNATGKVPLLKFTDLGFYSFMQTMDNPSVSLAEFRILAEGSSILANDYPDLRPIEFTTTSSGGTDAILGMALRNANKSGYRERMMLKFGVGLTNMSHLQANSSGEDRRTIDTLSSTQSPTQIFVDSINYTSVLASHSSNLVRFSLALIFSTNPESRISFYGGVGGYVGLAINSYSDVSHFESMRSALIDQSGNELFNANSEQQASIERTERFTNRNAFSTAVYVPVGAALRLSKGDSFWGRLSLFTELRPGFDFSNLPDYGRVSAGFMQFGLGARALI